MSQITIRPARSSDATVLERLAALDSQRPLTGAALLAEVCGDAVAAIDVETGRAVADPFEPTADVLELLRLRMHNARRGSRGRPARLLPRLA